MLFPTLKQPYQTGGPWQSRTRRSRRCIGSSLATGSVSCRQRRIPSHPLPISGSDCALGTGARGYSARRDRLRPVGAVLLLSDARLQLQCSHETLHGFVIDQLAFLTYHSRDTAVAILALMNLENPAHSPFETRRLVRHLQRLLRIVKGAACEAGHLEQASEWILLPQLKHDLRSLSCAACFFV